MIKQKPSLRKSEELHPYASLLNELEGLRLYECLAGIVPRGAKIMICDEHTSIHAILQSGSLNVKECNADADNSNKDAPKPFPLSEVKLNDDASK